MVEDADRFRRERRLGWAIGRDKKDCDNLENLAKTGDIVIKLKEMVGPTTVLRDQES